LHGYQQIYTGGSNEGTTVAVAAVWDPSLRIGRLMDSSSIFKVEAQASLLATDKVPQSTGDGFLVLSELLSCFEAIQNQEFTSLLVLEVVSHIDRCISD
jgi:hypothetical protein